jgi:hypothetical protein
LYHLYRTFNRKNRGRHGSVEYLRVILSSHSDYQFSTDSPSDTPSMAPVACERRQGRGRSRYCEVRNLSVEHRGAGNFARNYFGCIQGLTGIPYIMLFCHNTFCWFERHISKYIFCNILLCMYVYIIRM